MQIQQLLNRIYCIQKLNDDKNKKLNELQSQSSKQQHTWQAKEYQCKLAVMNIQERTNRADIREFEAEINRLLKQNRSLLKELQKIENNKDHYGFYFILSICILVILLPIFNHFHSKSMVVPTRIELIDEYNLIEQEQYDQIKQQNEELFLEMKYFLLFDHSMA